MASFTVVYLSETGVGQTIGERIHRESASHGLVCHLFNAMDFAKISWKDSQIYVFITSSTGEMLVCL
jgi:flavodoxin